METYSLPSWSVRRALGECREALEALAGSISMGEAFQYGPLIVIKLVATGAARVLPERPTFAELEGVDPETARLLDSADFALRGPEVSGAPARFVYGYYYKFLAQCGNGGVVLTPPGFYGRDP